MTEAKKDGGAAFPNAIQFSDRGKCANSDALLTGGMSLRDYFAAHAMIALHASDERGGRWDSQSEETCATNAYALADAMLKARSA